FFARGGVESVQRAGAALPVIADVRVLWRGEPIDVVRATIVGRALKQDISGIAEPPQTVALAPHHDRVVMNVVAYMGVATAVVGNDTDASGIPGDGVIVYVGVPGAFDSNA